MPTDLTIIVTALTSYNGSKNEETDQDSLSPLDDPNSEDLSPTNNTQDDLLHSFTPPSENENQSTHKLISKNNYVHLAVLCG